MANQSPANKIRRSKSKSRPMSKEKAREYKLGRRRKSAEKSEGKGKKSVEKEVTAKGGYTIKDESTTYPSLMPEGEVSVDRFEIIN